MSRWKRFVILLSVIGPGIITANVDNDAGGIATYSMAGAHFGYSLLWSLIPITIALIVVQEMSARMGAITGKGLAELIRENYGVKVTFWLMLSLFVTDLGNTAAEFAGWAASNEMFGVNKYISVPIAAFVVWLLVVKGSYRVVEIIFLVICSVYFVYIPAAFMARPDWGEVALETVRPTFHFSSASVVMLIGVVGTTIAPWMQFYIQASVVEKGVPLKDLVYSRIDAISGAVVVNIVAWFIVVACAATIYTNGVQVNNVVDISAALVPLAGQYASVLFAFGFLNASLFAASILPLSTAYMICEGLGLEAGVSRSFREAPAFHGLYLGIIVLGALIIMIPNAPLLSILYGSQVINGILLPVVLVFMLVIINDKKVMGEYVNSRVYNYITAATIIVMAALSVALIIIGV